MLSHFLFLKKHSIYVNYNSLSYYFFLLIFVIILSIYSTAGCSIEKNSNDCIDLAIGNVTKGEIFEYKFKSETIKNGIWSARIILKNDDLDETIAKRIASRILHEKLPNYDGLMFAILGVEEKDGIPIYQQVYKVKAAKTKKAATTIGRWDKSLPFVEFAPELVQKK